MSLRTDILTQQTTSGVFIPSCLELLSLICARAYLLDGKIANLEKFVQQLQDASRQNEDSLNETIKSLRADLHTQKTISSVFALTLAQVSGADSWLPIFIG